MRSRCRHLCRTLFVRGAPITPAQSVPENQKRKQKRSQGENSEKEPTGEQRTGRAGRAGRAYRVQGKCNPSRELFTMRKKKKKTSSVDVRIFISLFSLPAEPRWGMQRAELKHDLNAWSTGRALFRGSLPRADAQRARSPSVHLASPLRCASEVSERPRVYIRGQRRIHHTQEPGRWDQASVHMSKPAWGVGTRERCFLGRVVYTPAKNPKKVLFQRLTTSRATSARFRARRPQAYLRTESSRSRAPTA